MTFFMFEKITINIRSAVVVQITESNIGVR
jgi:hypothetical protein